MMNYRHGLLAVLTALAFSSAAIAEPERPECIAPAKPGGGFDLTCKLAQSALQDGKFLAAPMRVSYMPGGIGAVAFNTVVTQRPDEGGTLVAWSGGSLLNLAIGKFGKYSASDVRWVAAVGADYGAIVVRADSPYKTLNDLVTALKKDPSKIVFGAGGSVGSQDWMKSALIAKIAGIDYKKMRYVAFEGGGEAITNLMGGHVQVVSGDASEVAAQMKNGLVRPLAVLAEHRLSGDMANVPTAIEQGFNVDWTIMRGFYMGGKTSDADYKWWVDNFAKMMAKPEFAKLREERGLYPTNLTGNELTKKILAQVKYYAEISKEFGLVGN